MQNLISIITPCYNAGKYLSEAIESVISQTYTNWELLIVDDCSTDNSADIIKEYALKDSRIRYFKTDKPSGSPTMPRNIGIQNTKGRYISFLDADDVILPSKLETQVNCFVDEKTAIVFSNYEKMEHNGRRSGRIIKAPKVISYYKLLESGYVGVGTIMYDTQKTGFMQFQNVGQEDYVFALSILKKGYVAVNTNTIEALYRLVENSRSSNKIKVAKGQWNVLRNIEKLPFPTAFYYFCHYAIKGFLKYLK